MPTHSQARSTHRMVAAILAVAVALWLVSYYVTFEILRPAHAAAPDVRVASAEVEKTVNLRAEGDSLRERLERLSEHEVKRFYARCSQDGIDGRLDGAEAMACSVSYDVLLRKHFAGDFERLLLWSRQAAAASSR